MAQNELHSRVRLGTKFQVHSTYLRRELTIEPELNLTPTNIIFYEYAPGMEKLPFLKFTLWYA